MPGSTRKITTDGKGRDQTLSILFGLADPNPNFVITIYADSGNANPFYIGRGQPVIPLLAKDSVAFYSCRAEEVIVNDGGNAATFYADQSGPMDPKAQYATVVNAAAVGTRGKAPNDPTP